MPRALPGEVQAVHEQEVVIVGYTEPRRSRKYFGSLVLAVRDKATKRWVAAANFWQLRLDLRVLLAC
jgi:ATP-dependent DNA ligase